MALSGPRRIPRQFARRVSQSNIRLAEKKYLPPIKRQRQRHERIHRFMRRLTQNIQSMIKESKMWISITVGMVSISILIMLLFAPIFHVRSIRVERQNTSIDIEEVQRSLSFLFAQKLLLVSEEEVQTVIQELYPESTSIRIRKDYPSTLIVRITLEDPVARIVIENDTENGSGAILPSPHRYITKSGYLLESPLALREGPGLPVLTIVDWNTIPKSHSRLLSKEELENIFSARTIVKRDFNAEPKKIVIYLQAQEFHIITDKGALWFDQQSPLNESIMRLRTFLKHQSFSSVKEYIDLRVRGAILYK